MSDWGTLVRTVEPTQEPITANELADWLRLNDRDDTTLAQLSALITAARDHLERITRRAFLTQTWQYGVPAFPPENQWIELPRPILQTVSQIFYNDPAGLLQTFADFTAGGSEFRGLVFPAMGFVWPETWTGRPVAALIEFVAGWTSPAAMPESLKVAVKMLAAHWHEYRQPVTEIAANEIPLTVDALISPWRVLDYH